MLYCYNGDKLRLVQNGLIDGKQTDMDYADAKEKDALKQLFFIALTMLLFLGIACAGCAEDMPVMDWEPEDADIPLDTEHFPDDAFRTYLGESFERRSAQGS